MAIDRLEFPQVAWYRPDFASESLGDLMNRLALTTDGVLISRAALQKQGAKPGDQITLLVTNNTIRATMQFTIVGTYDYFPTVYDDVALTMVGNLEYLNSVFGFTVPHDLWLRLAPGTPAAPLLKALPGTLGIGAASFQESAALIASEQGKTERVGIFGTLSIGFLAAAIMAILGLLIYSYASLRDRVYRFGVLNAVGVSRGQIMAQLVLEYAFLVLFGVSLGALIGSASAQLFVPFFRFTGEKGVPLPPLLPVFAEQQVLLLVLAFTGAILLAELLTLALAFRQQLGKILR
jgi:putative ABC transport system permease protein